VGQVAFGEEGEPVAVNDEFGNGVVKGEQPAVVGALQRRRDRPAQLRVVPVPDCGRVSNIGSRMELSPR
jgi:hypothetical protein